MNYNVILDVFSGRKNPEFMLKTHESLIVYLKYDVSEKTDSINVPYLGYRGFVLRITGIDSLPKKIRVYKNTISFLKEGKTVFYRDLNGIEPYLFDLAQRKGHIKPDYTYDKLYEDLDRKNYPIEIQKKLLIQFYEKDEKSFFKILNFYNKEILLTTRSKNEFLSRVKANVILNQINRVEPLTMNDVTPDEMIVTLLGN